MVATLVGTGTNSSANNASVSTTFHGSTADGDLVIVHASIRSSGVGTPVQPGGWLPLALFANEAVYAKVWRTGDPTSLAVTFSGGSAGDDCIVSSTTFRGLSTTLLGAATQLNASAQDVAFPALSAPVQGGGVTMIFAWKQSLSTGSGSPAGFTGLSSPSSSAGSGATDMWRYRIDTAPAAVSAGTITVTGGVAAISRAIVLALSPIQVSVIPQNVWPPRNLITVAGLIVGDSVAIYRVVSGVRTLVQNGSTASSTDVAFLRVDAELPFGVPVTYVAVVNSVEYVSTTTVTDLPGGKVALTDAISGLAAEVVIWAWPNKRRPRQATVFKPGGRNVVVSGPMGQFEADVEVYTETTSSAENLADLLDGATQGIIQVRQAGPYDDIDCHAVVTDHTPRRYAQDGSDQKRIHALHLVEVSGWASALAATGFTYQDLSDTYVGLTYANLSADFATYLLLAQGDFS